MPIGPHRTVTQEVNVRDLERVFEAGAEVTPDVLQGEGPDQEPPDRRQGARRGQLTKTLSVTAHRFSQAAREKIEAAGGTAVALREPSGAKSRKARKIAAAKRAAGIVTPAEPEEAEATSDSSRPRSPRPPTTGVRAC